MFASSQMINSQIFNIIFLKKLFQTSDLSEKLYQNHQLKILLPCHFSMLFKTLMSTLLWSSSSRVSFSVSVSLFNGISTFVGYFMPNIRSIREVIPEPPIKNITPLSFFNAVQNADVNFTLVILQSSFIFGFGFFV